MRTINEQDVFDIIDDLRDQMTVEGYCAMVERVKALPSATCGNLEKPEIPQHSEGEAADCNLDCISRQMLLEYIHGEPVGKLLCDKYNLDGLIEQFPSAQPTLCGYDIKHLDLIARILQKEDLPPDRIVDALTDIGRIVEIVKDEYEEALRKAVEQCTI